MKSQIRLVASVGWSGICMGEQQPGNLGWDSVLNEVEIILSSSYKVTLTEVRSWYL